MNQIQLKGLKMVMKTSQNGLQLVKFSESPTGTPQLVSYPCSANKWTIGHGHTKNVTKGMTCTPGQAEIWFAQDVEEAESIVRAIVRDNVSQGVFDALVSFAFNFGFKKFVSYSLPKMINELAARKPTEEKWMEYIYSVRDDDGDGDDDACIDRGLVIRRIREILIGRGFSFKVAEASASSSNIYPEKEQRPWDNRDGFKEFLVNGDDLLAESVDRARSLAAFFGEADDQSLRPKPAPVAVKPPPAPAPKPKPEPKPVPVEKTIEEMDPTPETPLTTEDLNYISYVKIGGKKPFSEFSLTPEKLQTVKPEYKPEPPDKVGSVDMKVTTRFKGEHNRQAGIDMQKVGSGAAVTATVLGSVSNAVGAANKTTAETQTLVSTLPITYIVFGLLGFALLYVGIGWFRRWYGANQRYKGEVQASQYMH